MLQSCCSCIVNIFLCKYPFYKKENIDTSIIPIQKIVINSCSSNNKEDNINSVDKNIQVIDDLSKTALTASTKLRRASRDYTAILKDIKKQINETTDDKKLQELKLFQSLIQEKLDQEIDKYNKSVEEQKKEIIKIQHHIKRRNSRVEGSGSPIPEREIHIPSPIHSTRKLKDTVSKIHQNKRNEIKMRRSLSINSIPWKLDELHKSISNKILIESSTNDSPCPSPILTPDMMIRHNLTPSPIPRSNMNTPNLTSSHVDNLHIKMHNLTPSPNTTPNINVRQLILSSRATSVQYGNFNNMVIDTP